jgi:hypothetical protein
MNYYLNNILTFFKSRGWQELNRTNLFAEYSPPSTLGLPENYIIEIPTVSNKNGFEKYIDNLLDILVDIDPSYLSEDDYKIIFSKKHTIVSLRIIDQDTEYGSIKLERHIDSLDSIRKMYSQAVTFVSSRKPIFGNAKEEVKSFLDSCRALQTEKGSYVTKIEIPSAEQNSLFSSVNTDEVNKKLFSILEFVNSEVIKRKVPIIVNEKHIIEYSEFINYETLISIKDLFTKVKINDAEFEMNSYSDNKIIHTEKILPKIKYFNLYIKEVKDILLKDTVVEFTGFIKKLSSQSPKYAIRNLAILETEISNTKNHITIYLNNARYIEAIEAHKNERPVKVRGKVKQGQRRYVIQEVEEFDVL